MSNRKQKGSWLGFRTWGKQDGWLISNGKTNSKDSMTLSLLLSASTGIELPPSEHLQRSVQKSWITAFPPNGSVQNKYWHPPSGGSCRQTCPALGKLSCWSCLLSSHKTSWLHTRDPGQNCWFSPKKPGIRIQAPQVKMLSNEWMNSVGKPSKTS